MSSKSAIRNLHSAIIKPGLVNDHDYIVLCTRLGPSPLESLKHVAKI